MPRQYVAMRDKFAEGGMDYDKAQAKAAAIYNSKHPGAPVGSGSHESDKADEAAHQAKYRMKKKLKSKKRY
jgi:hypothetical protein